MALSKHLQTLIPLFSFVALFLMLANKVHSADETSFSFDAFDPKSSNLTYQGDAYVPSGSRVLHLNKVDLVGFPEILNVGRVLYSKPIQFWRRPLGGPLRQANFETTIKFTIKPSIDGAADGIAFFIAPVNTTIPSDSAGGNLGIFNSSGTASSTFAVEFDTYVNPLWDPSYRHIGININSKVSKATTNFDSGTGQNVTARINYDGNTRTVMVTVTSGSQTRKLSFVYDLTSVLHKQVQVGISASTGLFPLELGIFEVYSWHFHSTLVPIEVRDCCKNEGTYIRQNVPM